MKSYVTDTQAIIKFMMGKKVIDEKSHRIFLSADRGESIIIIPAVVLMEMYVAKNSHVRNGVTPADHKILSELQGFGLVRIWSAKIKRGQRAVFCFFRTNFMLSRNYKDWV